MCFPNFTSSPISLKNGIVCFTFSIFGGLAGAMIPMVSPICKRSGSIIHRPPFCKTLFSKILIFDKKYINCDVSARLLSTDTSPYFEHRTYSCYRKWNILAFRGRLMSLLVLTHSGVSPRPHLPQESRIFHLLG